MPNETKQIGFRGTEEYRRELQQAAHDRHIKVQQLIERALEFYLAEEEPMDQSRVGMEQGLGSLTDHQRRIVLATVAFLRDKAVPEQFENVLECFLADYLKQGRGQRGKKRA